MWITASAPSSRISSSTASASPPRPWSPKKATVTAGERGSGACAAGASAFADKNTSGRTKESFDIERNRQRLQPQQPRAATLRHVIHTQSQGGMHAESNDGRSEERR